MSSYLYVISYRSYTWSHPADFTFRLGLLIWIILLKVSSSEESRFLIGENILLIRFALTLKLCSVMVVIVIEGMLFLYICFLQVSFFVCFWINLERIICVNCNCIHFNFHFIHFFFHFIHFIGNGILRGGNKIHSYFLEEMQNKIIIIIWVNLSKGKCLMGYFQSLCSVHFIYIFCWFPQRVPIILEINSIWNINYFIVICII